MGGLTGVDDLVRCVKQRLGRDAAAIEANAPEDFVALDKDDFFAQVRRVKGGGITAGPRADHDNFSFDGIHKLLNPPRARSRPRPRIFGTIADVVYNFRPLNIYLNRFI